MTTPLDQLLASLDRLYAHPARTDLIHMRQQLDLLIAASDDDAAAAIARYREPLIEVLTQSPRFWLSYLGERPDRWLSGALAYLPEPVVPSHARVLLAALAGHRMSGPVPRLFEQLLGDPAERAHAARLVARYQNAAAWEMLRRHDGPDLDLDLRLAALLGATPTAAQPGLAAFLGSGASRELRAASLAWLLARRDHAVLHADVLPLVEGCLDDGVAPAAAIRFLLAHVPPRSPQRPLVGAHRRLFDRLWPIAQGRPPLPWPDVDVSLFFGALVQTAPAPELVAILLDTLDDREFSRALVQAIEQRPDAYLVPALERWAQANPAKVTQKIVQPALAACRQVPGGD